MNTTRKFFEPMISSVVDGSIYIEMSWTVKAAATTRGSNPARSARTVAEPTTPNETGRANLSNLKKIRNLLEQSIALTKGIDRVSSP